MGTPIRPQLLSSSKKTKALYVMISKFPNIRSTFPIQISNSFQFLSPDFPPLQPSKSFIQVYKSTSKSIHVQNQSSPSTISILLSLSSFTTSQYVKKPKTLEILSLNLSSLLKKFLKSFITSFLKESILIQMII